jgi:hypothetical protein
VSLERERRGEGEGSKYKRVSCRLKSFLGVRNPIDYCSVDPAINFIYLDPRINQLGKRKDGVRSTENK